MDIDDNRIDAASRQRHSSIGWHDPWKLSWPTTCTGNGRLSRVIESQHSLYPWRGRNTQGRSSHSRRNCKTRSRYLCDWSSQGKHSATSGKSQVVLKNCMAKTIDNDIAHISRTFGFDTAVSMAQAPIKAAHEEARSAKNGIGIVKLMGRESGFIGLHAALASGDVNLLLLPEMKFCLDKIMEFLMERFKVSSHCLIVISESRTTFRDRCLRKSCFCGCWTSSKERNLKEIKGFQSGTYHKIH